MLFRIVSVLIVAFWLVMSGLLVQLTYFPEESRLAEVDPDVPVGRFLKNEDPSELAIYKDGKRVGDLMLQARKVKADDLSGGREVDFRASGEVELPNLPRQLLRWHGALSLGADRSIEKVVINVRFEEPDALVNLSVDPRTRTTRYTVTKDNQEVATGDSSDANAPGAAQMQMLLMAWGVNPAALEDPNVAAAEQERLVNLSARHGQIEVGTQRIHAYILTLKVMGEQEIKFYLDEAGEILKVTTFLGYEMLSDLLAPVTLQSENGTPAP